MALFWPKHGPQMVLPIGTPWILINAPRAAPCQISHCRMFPVNPFPGNSQNMALYGPNMVRTWSFKLVFSWIIINVPRDAPCKISQFWVYPIVHFFLEMAKMWPFYGPNMVWIWSSQLVCFVLCKIWQCRVYTVVPSLNNGQKMALLWPKHGPSNWFFLNLNKHAQGCSMQNLIFQGVPLAHFPKNGQNMALLWPKHGPNMVLQIGSYWILIIVPRDVLCQIFHCWVYPVALFPRNCQNMALYGQSMILTWSSKLVVP